MSYSAPLPIKALRGFKVVAALSLASIPDTASPPTESPLRREFLNNEGGVVCSFVSPWVWCVFLWRAPFPALAPRCLCWACWSVGGFRSRPRRRGLLSSSSGCVLFVRVLCLFFPLFFLRGVFLFSYLCLWFSVLSVAAFLFSSASAVVASVGFSRLRCLFAGFVVGIPAGPGSSPSCRVAAACPAFAGALVGRGLCGWSVAWSVASLVASSWGVSVLSGGVPAPGVQLSLFS